MLTTIITILSVLTIIGGIVYFVGFYRNPQWDKFVQMLDKHMLTDADRNDYCDFCGTFDSEHWWIGLREEGNAALSCDKCKHNLYDESEVDKIQ